MERIGFELKLNQIPRIYTKEQSLADDIVKTFKMRISFSKVMGLIKEKGYQRTYEAFNEVKNSEGIRKPIALFIWKLTR